MSSIKGRKNKEEKEQENERTVNYWGYNREKTKEEEKTEV